MLGCIHAGKLGLLVHFGILKGISGDLGFFLMLIAYVYWHLPRRLEVFNQIDFFGKIPGSSAGRHQVATP
jgi:hypothetical protein